MPIKVKFLLGIMTTAAVLIGLGFFVNTKNLGILGANISEILKESEEKSNLGGSGLDASATPCSDIDSDGLCDNEEPLYRTDPLNPDTDGDGFLDGEEIASGRDPTIPGPDDVFLFLNKNLTEKLATLTVSGLYEGSLKPDNPDFDKSINMVISSVLADASDSLSGNLETPDLKIVNSDKLNQEKYIKGISKLYTDLLANYFSELNDLQEKLEEINRSGFGNNSVKNYFNDKTTVFQNIFNKLAGVDVPENWELNHLNLLQTAKKLVIINSTIASGENDPIKAMIALNGLTIIADKLFTITESYVKKIEEQKLDVKSTIFQK